VNRFCFLVGLAGIIGGPIYLFWRISEDMAHPELWADPLHNPTVDFLSVGVLAVIVVLGAVVLIRLGREGARREREMMRMNIEWMEQERRRRRQ